MPRASLGAALATVALAGCAATDVPSPQPSESRSLATGPSTVAPTPSPLPTPSPSPSPSVTETAAETLRVAELVDPGWIAEVAARAEVPERAMAAYAGASVAVAEDFPDCNLAWNTLAAIGFVETIHGSWNGAALSDDGLVSPPILGIPLDGKGTIAVRDTDDGLLDGDTTWDRAVGPMQFIPSTWEIYGRDGNGDGTADPHHIDDASYSAAVYLCDVGGDLDDPERWIAAVNAYNPSVAYNNKVVEAANRYASTS